MTWLARRLAFHLVFWMGLLPSVCSLNSSTSLTKNTRTCFFKKQQSTKKNPYFDIDAIVIFTVWRRIRSWKWLGPRSLNLKRENGLSLSHMHCTAFYQSHISMVKDPTSSIGPLLFKKLSVDLQSASNLTRRLTETVTSWIPKHTLLAPFRIVTT